MDTAHIDKKHIEAVASKFEESGSTKETVEPLGKGRSMRLRGAEDIFQHSKLAHVQRKRPNTQTAVSGKEEYTDCVKSEVKVGKLSKDAFKPAPDSPKEERLEVKVGDVKRNKGTEIVVSGAGKNQHKGPLCTS